MDGQGFVDGHAGLGLVFLVAVVQAGSLQPAGQRTLALEVLHLALPRIPAGSQHHDIYLINELLAVVAVGIVVVVDGLEEGVALLVEIPAGNHVVPLYQGIGYSQVFMIYPLDFH